MGVTTESPSIQTKRDLEVEDLFHWISWFRKDADIFWPYGTYIKRTVPLKATPAPPEKTKYKPHAFAGN